MFKDDVSKSHYICWHECERNNENINKYIQFK